MTGRQEQWKAQIENNTPVRSEPFQDEKTAAEKLPALSKNQRSQTENRIKKLESEIADLEKQLVRLGTEMSDPKIAGDFDKLNSVTLRHAETDSKIKSLYAEWDTLTSQIEQ